MSAIYVCKCGWEGDDTDLYKRHNDEYYRCPDCDGQDFKIKDDSEE